MADQTRKPKPKKEEEAPQAAESATTEEKDEELEDLLDEIDEVLEANAEDFVRSFVQKGGELVVPGSLFFGPNTIGLVEVILVAFVYLIWRMQRTV